MYLFCEKLVTNFPRHLERNHISEPEVNKFILLPKKDKERIMHLELLKNKGNLQHNRNVLEKNKGALIVGRRPLASDVIEAGSFLPCKHCFKFIKKKNIISPHKSMSIQK